MLVVSWFISGIAYFLLYDYIFNFVIFKNKYKISIRSIIIGITFAILNCILLEFKMEYVKPYIIHVYLIFIFLLIYKKSFVKTLLCVLYALIIIFIAELIYGIIAILILKLPMDKFNLIWYYYLLSNIIVLLQSIGILKIPLVLKLIDITINWYNENEYKSLIIFVFLCLIIITFLLYNNFISLLPPSLLWLTNLFCIGVFTFIIGFFREKTIKNKIIYEYDQLLDYVKTYENLLEERSKSQHEHNNQLATIKNMSKNKKITGYINDLLDIEEEKVDVSWLDKLKYIPQGGLKGLIYYKIDSMLKKDINIFLDVSSELKSEKIWRNCDNNLKDISKILGVYLDNAIEACLEAKEKYIIITVSLENKQIIFEISNTYSNHVDISKVDQSGYTTKGVGKGYGLSLVKDIIDTNDSLSQKKQLNGIYYVQKLYIKK